MFTRLVAVFFGVLLTQGAVQAKDNTLDKPKLPRKAPLELKEELYAYWDRCVKSEAEACVQLGTVYDLSLIHI